MARRLNLGHRVVFLLAGIATGTSVAIAGQSAATPPGQPSASIADRLTRVQADLFGPANHLDEDVGELKTILAAAPQSSQGHMLLGLAYQALGTPALIGEAKAELREALTLDPDLVTARLALAQLYLALGRYDSVRTEMQTALARTPNQAQFLALLGEAERRLGHPERSVQLNQQAMAADPTLGQAHYYLACALLDLGRRAEGIRDLEQIVGSPGVPPDVYLTLGTAYLDDGQAAAAVRTLEQAATLAPSRTDIHLALGRAYRTAGQLTQAAAQLTLAEPPAASAQATEDYQNAETNLRVEWGRLRLQQDDLSAAQTAFQAAVTMSPDSGAGHLGLAEVFLRQHQYGRAREEAAAAGKLGSMLPAAERQALDAAAPQGRGTDGRQ